jgi:hypothetical protein
VLLPSATVFLLLLCNDKPVLGPWVNGRGLNMFTGARMTPRQIPGRRVRPGIAFSSPFPGARGLAPFAPPL